MTDKIIVFQDIIHRPVFYLEYGTFRRLESVSVFRWKLLSWAQSIDLESLYLIELRYCTKKIASDSVAHFDL
jgi:hypothetical protein